MDPGSFWKELLIYAALEANQITLLYNSADNFLIDSFQLEKYRYRERDWHALDLTAPWLSSQNIHQSTYKNSARLKPL